MELIGYIASIFIGITLGLIGGGGSIITVPILVYLFHLNPELATSYSLFIVGITSLVGAYKQYVLGNLKLNTALIFALSSLCSLLLVRKFLLPNIPAQVFQIGHFSITKNILIMGVFAILMLVSSYSMIKSQKEILSKQQKPNLAYLLILGFLIGIVTGFLGAGGGFLIIPALFFFANMPMKQTIGTSLFIITINSLIGFTGDIIHGFAIDYKLLLIVSAIAISGMIIGTQLSKKVDASKLKPLFGWFIFIMGVYILIKEIFL